MQCKRLTEIMKNFQSNLVHLNIHTCKDTITHSTCVLRQYKDMSNLSYSLNPKWDEISRLILSVRAPSSGEGVWSSRLWCFGNLLHSPSHNPLCAGAWERLNSAQLYAMLLSWKKTSCLTTMWLLPELLKGLQSQIYQDVSSTYLLKPLFSDTLPYNIMRICNYFR